MDPETRAKYSCDACRTRKMSCSREMPRCARCKAQGTTCAYSRSGIIRRKRKRKTGAEPPRRTSSMLGADSRGSSRQSSPSPAPSQSSDTTGRLRGLVGKDHPSLRELASLMAEYHATWQASTTYNKLYEDPRSKYFLFSEDRMRVWVQEMESTISKIMPMGITIPSNVVDRLVASLPHQVDDRAWLVIFYSVAYAMESATSTTATLMVARLRSNLWLAFNDVRLLLEPSVLNIQAMVIMATVSGNLMTPHKSRSLVVKACTMLLDMGIGVPGRLDDKSRQQYTAIFWRLSFLDQLLALVLSKPPIFQRELAKTIPLIEFNQLILSSSGYTLGRGPLLFNAHYNYQISLLTRIMADTWCCFCGKQAQDVPQVRSHLEIWYLEAVKVLEASALAEKPLLGVREAESVQLHLHTLHFHYFYLDILLTIASDELRSQCIHPAQGLLNLLPDLGDHLSSLDQPTLSVIWQWLHYPMIAFGVLWGHLLSKGWTDHEQSENILQALEYVPIFLEKIGTHHTMAQSMASISNRILRHVRLVYHSFSSKHHPLASALESTPYMTSVDGEQLVRHLDADPYELTSNMGLSTGTSNASTNMALAPAEGISLFPDDFFLDSGFDWVAWGDQLP